MIFRRPESMILLVSLVTIYGYSMAFGYLGSNVKRSLRFGAETDADDDYLNPENNNNSIQYFLYTPKNPKSRCYFEPSKTNKCDFNSTNKFIFMIHGYSVQLLSGNFFEQIKDTLLENNKYNVVIVNWTSYNSGFSLKAKIRSYQVGVKVGEAINFLVSDKEVNPANVHIIGHSLGAHVAGVAGKQVPKLGRVTGLDPAGPLFTEFVSADRLSDSSADFVDVIHTTNYKTVESYGVDYALGSIDFYPNGGERQPGCQMGSQYRNADATVNVATSPGTLGSCYHNIVLIYFMNSIHECSYPSVQCKSYEAYSEGKCSSKSNPTNRMGFHAEKIPGLPPKSMFYLNTSAISPYCEK